MGELIHHKREKIHWEQAAKKGGNPFALNPHPFMLTSSGKTVLRSFKKQGRGYKDGSETEWYDVIYDESYVIEWLLSRVVGCFPGITHVQMRELFTKALKLRKEREESKTDANKQAL